MKKLFCLVLCFVLLTASALAEVTTVEELEAMTREELITLAAELLGITAAEDTGSAEEEPAQYTVLQKGDKSEAVKALQARLIEQGYLSGKADGSYGKGTASAVELFQGDAGLEKTGIADVATQEKLFADDCPKAVVYGKLDYKGDSRNSDQYEGQYVKFDGKILQVIEEDNIVAFRIATKKNYDDVVFVYMIKPEKYSRFLEDDKVTVYGMYDGLYTYETVRGDSLTIPLIKANEIILK